MCDNRGADIKQNSPVVPGVSMIEIFYLTGGKTRKGRQFSNLIRTAFPRIEDTGYASQYERSLKKGQATYG